MKMTSDKKSLRQSRKSIARSDCKKYICNDCLQKPVSLSKTSIRNNNENLQSQSSFYFRSRDPFLQLLNWQCKIILNRINQSSVDSQMLSEVIICVLKALMPKNRKIRQKMNSFNSSSNYVKGYTRGLGWICAQVSRVYKDKDESVNTIIKILQLSDFDKEKKIQFGKEALKFHLDESPSHSKQIIANINIGPLISRYLDSLLFQFIPAEYAKFILDLYLHQYQELLGNLSSWENQPRPKQFFKVMCSLIHYILIMKKPVSRQHFEYMCANSYMGVIQWPIVIANRSLFQYPEKVL